MPRHRHRRKPNRKRDDFVPPIQARRKMITVTELLHLDDCGASCGRCDVCIATSSGPTLDWD